jgi:hypothetical protein
MNGFMETTDVDRITIQLDQARTSATQLPVQQAAVARMMLALALGLPQGTPITLTDDLTKILSRCRTRSRIERDSPYRAGQPHRSNKWPRTSCCSQDLQRKNERSKALPSLGAFLSATSRSGTGPTSIPEASISSTRPRYGVLKLTVPIFSSTQPHPEGEAGGALRAEAGRGEPHRHRAGLKVFAEQSRSQARTAYDNFKHRRT